VYVTLPLRVTLELANGAMAQKNWNDWGEEKLDDIYGRFNTVHERDGRTDGQTPADALYRASA